MDGVEWLEAIAAKAMQERGLEPQFSKEVLNQLEMLDTPAVYHPESMRDLRDFLWCSIDNDDSLDLDQLTVAYRKPGGGYRVYIAVADVDALVYKNSPIDLHAQINTTSVYTPAKIFPMLPEKLSTDLTSLNEHQDRVAVVFELELDEDMEKINSAIYRAVVRNQAKLAYSRVGTWLEGRAPMPEKVAAVPGLEETLRLQDQIAQSIKRKRHAQGALTFETIELKPLFKNGNVSDLKATERNRAHELIENLMISANTVSAQYAIKHRMPGLRRIVRAPTRWDRIVALARTCGESLPFEPDAMALDRFLKARKAADPETFPDLSLSVIKLLGSGEYVVEVPGDAPIGHFGLALRDYTHSTAPNRRYPDMITQRLLKATFENQKLPYTIFELQALAKHCTACEDAAAKVERRLKKCAAAMLLEDRIGETFQAMVTGASQKGIWVRLHSIPIEGKLVQGGGNIDVGDRVNVRLVSVDVMQGFIDFVRVS